VLGAPEGPSALLAGIANASEKMAGNTMPFRSVNISAVLQKRIL
jgi:hypothetical protein